jgi:hypothetical protein
MLVVRVDDFVKDRRPPEAAALRAVLDKIINTNTVPSKRSRPLSRPLHIFSFRTFAGVEPFRAHAKRPMT